MVDMYMWWLQLNFIPTPGMALAGALAEIN